MATKPVVVGVDGSEESLLAVEWAALEARRHSSPLRIVSAPASVPRVHAYHASPAEIAAALRGISARALAAGEFAPWPPGRHRDRDRAGRGGDQAGLEPPAATLGRRSPLDPPNDPGQQAWAETRLVPRARGSLPAGRRLKEMA